MPAYDYIDSGILGLYDSTGAVIQGRWVAGEEIEFGQPVFAYEGDEKVLYNYKLDTAILVFDADFVTGNTIDLDVNAESISQVTFTTDHDTTASLLVSAISALTGVICILDTTDTNNRTFLIQVKGDDALIENVVVASGASQAGSTVTYDSSQVHIGISVFFQNSTGLYELYDPMNVLTEGQIYVLPNTSVTANSVAYVDIAGTDKGSFSDTGLAIDAMYRANASASALVQVEMLGGKTYSTYSNTFV